MYSQDLDIAKMLDVCGYSNYKSTTEISCAIIDMENEGYIVSDYTKKIISEFFKMKFGPRSVKCNIGEKKGDTLSFLKNRFIIDPTITDLKEEIDRMEEVSSILGDYIVPIGIYNGDFLSVGFSKKIYSVVASVNARVDLLGIDFEDFLLRYYHNSLPILSWDL